MQQSDFPGEVRWEAFAFLDALRRFAAEPEMNERGDCEQADAG